MVTAGKRLCIERKTSCSTDHSRLSWSIWCLSCQNSAVNEAKLTDSFGSWAWVVLAKNTIRKNNFWIYPNMHEYDTALDPPTEYEYSWVWIWIRYEYDTIWWSAYSNIFGYAQPQFQPPRDLNWHKSDDPLSTALSEIKSSRAPAPKLLTTSNLMQSKMLWHWSWGLPGT